MEVVVASAAEPKILHVDMDAFFAAVEVLRDPSLVGKAVIVGGAGARGVVASCSYEARMFGVRSAMPSVRARRLCPSAVFVDGNMSRYVGFSERIHEVFSSFTPLVEGISLDEAFLDVAGARRLFGTSEDIARLIRERVLWETGLQCSVGVAPSKLVAKLASRQAKPMATAEGIVPGAGIVVVRAGEELAFLHPLKVTELWGVGPATAERLRGRGVGTVGELAAIPRDVLISWVGKAHGRHLHDLAWARDSRPVEPHRSPKSVGYEETFAVDLVDRTDLRRALVRQADTVATRLRGASMAGRTVTVKVRFMDFTTITRSRTLPGPVDTAPDLVTVAGEMLDNVDARGGVRLLGLSVSNLTAGAATDQLALGNVGAGWGEASRAMDGVRARFGTASVGPAALVEASGVRVRRRGDHQWGPSEDTRP